jgi:hypothetical protein
MAINWMDNFNIYGTDGSNVARMLNGVYAEVSGALAVDPDPTAGGSLCFKLNDLGANHIRKVLPVARTTVGVAQRNWLTSLPAAGSQRPVFVEFCDVGNNPHVYTIVDPSGNIVAYRHDSGGDVLLGSTANPVLIANAWQHMETKVVLDAVAGSIEVRIEGVSVLNLAGIRTTSNGVGVVASCQNVSVLNAISAQSVVYYIKDFIIWDSTTGFNNNFMGSCQVMKIIPDADVALNWTPSAGGTGFNLINEVTPDDDGSYISAPAPGIPAAYKCSLSDLPITVTSVRGVMPVHRSRKTDGGDGNIQIGAISGASTGLGVDRPITTAYTYYWDIYDADPATAAAWSRVSVNAMNLQINRTL